MASVGIALRKRPVPQERIERMVSGIVRRLESLGESEIKSETVGKLVMEALKMLDDVAYVRFASVYKNFREAKDFEELLAFVKAVEFDHVGVFTYSHEEGTSAHAFEDDVPAAVKSARQRRVMQLQKKIVSAKQKRSS